MGRVAPGSVGPLPEARVFLLKNEASYDRYGRAAGERAYQSILTQQLDSFKEGRSES